MALKEFSRRGTECDWDGCAVGWEKELWEEAAGWGEEEMVTSTEPGEQAGYSGGGGGATEDKEEGKEGGKGQRLAPALLP